MPATIMFVEVLVGEPVAAEPDAKPPPTAWRIQAMVLSIRKTKEVKLRSENRVLLAKMRDGAAEKGVVVRGEEDGCHFQPEASNQSHDLKAGRKRVLEIVVRISTHVTICMRNGSTKVTFLLDRSRPDRPMTSMSAAVKSVG